MEALATITGISIVMWWIIDRGKALIWGDWQISKYITMAAALILSAAVTFGYGLDLVNALGLVPEVSVVGKILTMFSFMGGSSGLAELIGAVQKKGNYDYDLD